MTLYLFGGFRVDLDPCFGGLKSARNPKKGIMNCELSDFSIPVKVESMDNFNKKLPAYFFKKTDCNLKFSALFFAVAPSAQFSFNFSSHFAV